MAWTLSDLGTIAGITASIAGITGPGTDAAQISSAKTFLTSEMTGVSTALYNGAKIVASGDVQNSVRTFQFTIIPLDLAGVS
jgi:hypothetical protein